MCTASMCCGCRCSGTQVVFTRLGVALAMVFVSFPFVVRTMQPVIQVRAWAAQLPVAQLQTT